MHLSGELIQNAQPAEDGINTVKIKTQQLSFPFVSVEKTGGDAPLAYYKLGDTVQYRIGADMNMLLTHTNNWLLK